MYDPTDRIAYAMAFVMHLLAPPCGIDPMIHRAMSERSTSQLRPAPRSSTNIYITVGSTEYKNLDVCNGILDY